MTVTITDNRVPVTGTRTFAGTTTSLTQLSGTQRTLNSTGHPHPYTVGGYFLTQTITATAGTIHGTYAGVTFNGYPFTVATHPGIASPSVPSIAGDLARTNPSKPIVDVPIFLFELREAPNLIRIAGNNLIQKIASSNLNYQFGWKPLLSDLSGLLNLQSSIDKRAAHLSYLHANGGQKVSTKKARVTRSDSGWTTVAFPGDGSSLQAQYHGFAERWVTSSWVPIYDPRTGIPTINQIRQQAFRSTLGLTIDLSTVWNALPWTWLIDWFSNVGDFLETKRNICGFVPGPAWQMYHTESTAAYRYVGGSLTKTLPSYTSVRKERTSASPSVLSASVPILTNRQLGILASLAVTRR